MKERKEIKYYGIHAVLALFERRPQDIIRVYIDNSNIKTFGPLLKWCSENKKAYHIIPNLELNRVSDSVHHEGICVLAKELPSLTEEELFRTLKGKEHQFLLYLDGVENPHNLGSIVRTAAHFGVFSILGEKGKLPALSPSACRIAKGGAEFVKLVPLVQPLETLKKLKMNGFTCIGTSSHGGKSLYQYAFPAKTILVMGAESEGVSKALFKMATENIQIAGTDLVESLNVSVATSLCMGEYTRQYQTV